MKSFLLFTAGVSMLTVVGVSTIWVNMTIRNLEAQEGLLGFLDSIWTILLQSPQLGFQPFVVFDMVLIQASLFHGLFAATILLQFIVSIRANESEIDGLKKESLRKRGLTDQIKDRPPRSLRQTLSLIFAQSRISWESILTPSTHHKRELTFELMLKACIEEFYANTDDTQPADLAWLQKCDRFAIKIDESS